MSGTMRETKGVKTLLGDPRKAIIKLSIPMVAAMSAQTIYNLADAIWVSGKGPESLSAVGFTFPFVFLVMAIANGVGIGGGAAISRKIGARDSESLRIADDLVLFLRIVCWLLPTAAFGMLSSGMFQGVGKGFTALVMTLTRTLVLAVPFAWVLGVYLHYGLAGIWAGITASGLVYIPIAFGWAMLYIRRLQPLEHISGRNKSPHNP